MGINLKVGDAFGDAVFLGEFESNTPEWHELRATGIGGSDIASIVGVSKYQSAYALWAKKRGLIDSDVAMNEAMEWGNRLESVIFDKFAEENPHLKLHKVGTFRNKDRAFQVVNPDGIIEYPDGSYGILEIKTAAYEDDWVNGIPRYYQTQVQWYMQAFGFKKSVVAVLFAGRKYRTYDLPANELEQEINLEEVIRFLGYVESGTKPDWDGSESTYEAIRAIHPDIDAAEVDLGDIAIHLVNAYQNYQKAEEHFQMMKSITLDNMGTARVGVYEEENGNKIQVCTRQAKKFGLPYLVMKK